MEVLAMRSSSGGGRSYDVQGIFRLYLMFIESISLVVFYVLNIWCGL